MIDTGGLRERHEALLAGLRAIAEREGHDPDRLRIVGVTKTHPVAVVRAAVDAGIRLIGENRVQEAEPKVMAVPEAEWHLVGQLQRNKVRRALRLFAVIHSVDSVALLRRVAEIAAEEGRTPRLLLQVNVTGEVSKGGFAPDALLAAETLSAVRALPVAGLMTIGAFGADEADARRAFARLRGLRDRLREETSVDLPELSMGMSGDAEAAAAEGATLVRIGTALFGPRSDPLLSSAR